ncbi:MAG: protein kinase, partial [Nanoarchaeota archaeon]
EFKEEYDFLEQRPGGTFKQLVFHVRRKQDGLECALLIFSRDVAVFGSGAYGQERLRSLDDAFIQESLLLSRLPRDRHIARMHRFGINPVHYMLTEWIPGTRLDALDRSILDVSTRVELFYQAAEAVCALHAYNVDGTHMHLAHRDIKAGNMIRRDDGVLFLLDFEQAMPASYERLSPIQRHGSVLYRSPEEVTVREANLASDMFSLGLFGCLFMFDEYPMNPTKDDVWQFMRRWAAGHGRREIREPLARDVLRKIGCWDAAAADETIGRIRANPASAGYDVLIDVLAQCLDPDWRNRPAVKYIVDTISSRVFGGYVQPSESWNFQQNAALIDIMQAKKNEIYRRAVREGVREHGWERHYKHLYNHIRSYGDLMVQLRDGNPSAKVFTIYMIADAFPVLSPAQQADVIHVVQNMVDRTGPHDMPRIREARDEDDDRTIGGEAQSLLKYLGSVLQRDLMPKKEKY